MKKSLLLILLFFTCCLACFSQDHENEVITPAENTVPGTPTDEAEPDADITVSNTSGSVRRICDWDFRFYTSSMFGFVTGNNPLFGLRENTDEVKECNNFMIESRFSIFETDILTMSCSFASGGYCEFNCEDNTNLDSFNISLGLGLYFHLFGPPELTLNGLCLYLYPMYQIPVFSHGYTPYLSWKSAFDIGYNFAVLGAITVYPYIRNIIGWNSQDIRYGIDLGIAIGLYFPDNGNHNWF